jgi:hypothetical protein
MGRGAHFPRICPQLQTRDRSPYALVSYLNCKVIWGACYCGTYTMPCIVAR